MTKAIMKDTIHAGGIDIGIYTTDFKNEYITHRYSEIQKYSTFDYHYVKRRAVWQNCTI